MECKHKQKMNGLGWDEAVAWTDTEQTGGKGAIGDTRVPECTVHSIKGYQCTACKCTNSVLGFQCTVYQYTSIPVHSLAIYLPAHSMQGCQEDTNSVPAHSWRSGELEHSIKVYHLKFVPTQPSLVVQNKQDHSKRKHNAERGRQWRETNRRITSVILEDVQRRDLYGRNVNWIPDIVLYLLTEATGAILGIGW